MKLMQLFKSQKGFLILCDKYMVPVTINYEFPTYS